MGASQALYIRSAAFDLLRSACRWSYESRRPPSSLLIMNALHPLPGPLPSSKLPTNPKAFPGKVMLSSRSQVDCLNAGLHSVQGTFPRIYSLLNTHDLIGANQIISMIKARPRATKLILDHNRLGDDGCEALFRFLSSEDGKKKNISEIKIVKNNIGDKGLLAITQYLTNNKCLKELQLQGVSTNDFVHDVFALTKYAYTESLPEYPFSDNCLHRSSQHLPSREAQTKLKHPTLRPLHSNFPTPPHFPPFTRVIPRNDRPNTTLRPLHLCIYLFVPVSAIRAITKWELPRRGWGE